MLGACAVSSGCQLRSAHTSTYLPCLTPHHIILPPADTNQIPCNASNKKPLPTQP